jgi:hypothetical protein
MERPSADERVPSRDENNRHFQRGTMHHTLAGTIAERTTFRTSNKIDWHALETK